MFSARASLSTFVLIVLAVLIVLPAISSVYLVNVAFFLLVSLVLAQSWNWVGGDLGYINLGHGLYFGVGAYSFGIALAAGYSPLICFVFTASLNIALAGLLAVPLFRMHGHYFAFGTLALVPLAELLAFNLRGITGGTDGIVLPTTSSQSGSYYGALVLAVAVVAISFVATRSKLGLMMRCIRNDEEVSETIGIRTLPVKIAVFVVSGAFASLGGAVHAYQLGFVDPPSVFGLSVALAPIVMTLFGGSGRLLGPVVGVLLLGAAQQFMLVHLSSLHVVLYGGAILLIGRFMPGGILGAEWLQGTIKRLNEHLWSSGGTTTDRVIPNWLSIATHGAARGGDLVSFEAVSMSFGGNTVLNNINLTIRAGEIVGLVGPNGSGKTTLFNCLSGIYAPKAGRIMFEGASTSRLRRDEISRLGVARTFQIPRPFSDMSVLENIMAAVSFSGRSGDLDVAGIEDASRSLAAYVGLQDRLPVRADTLSTQERKMLEFARALGIQPRLLLIDEVASGLSPAELKRFGEVVRQARDELRITVIWVEHIIGALSRAADRIVVLEQGAVIANGSSRDVFSDERVRKSYLTGPDPLVRAG
jgi:branched-chain amino acid transport system permease protein